MFRALQINGEDNVATALEDLPAFSQVDILRRGRLTGELVTAREPVAFAFKIAVRPIDIGTPVIKYGDVIGLATARIEAGDLVHVHNMEGMRGRGDKTPAPAPGDIDPLQVMVEKPTEIQHEGS